MISLDGAETRFAIDAVRQASRLVQQVQAEMGSPALTKEDLSPVTVADFASQALVGYLIEKFRPQDSFVGEEDSDELRKNPAALEYVTGFVSRFAGRVTSRQVCEWIDRGMSHPGRQFWVLDPIDGTKGFLRGDQYVVALALIVEGEVRLGVLGCPNLDPEFLAGGLAPVVVSEGKSGALTVAVRGAGAWLTHIDGEDTFTPLNVSGQDNPRQARILRSFEAAHTNTGQIDRVAQKLGVQVDPVRMDSQAKYALLAAGRGEIYLRLLSPQKPGYREKIWDQAAGSLLVEEAGGRVTDLDGKALDFSTGRILTRNRGVLASNTRLHKAALKAIQDS